MRSYLGVGADYLLSKVSWVRCGTMISMLCIPNSLCVHSSQVSHVVQPILPLPQPHSVVRIFFTMKAFVFTVFLLLRTHASRADSVFGSSAIQKSEHCIQAAREAYDLLNKKETDVSTTNEIIAHLETLAEDGKYLKKSAEGFISELEAKEKELDKTLQQLQQEKQQLETSVIASKNEKANIEKDHSSKQSIFRDFENQLKRTQKELQDAENELHHAKKKLKKKKRGLFGKLKSALGKLVGHVTSAEKKVKRAKSNLDRRRSEIKSAQNAANAAEKAKKDVENKIKQQELKVQEIQKKADAKHKEIGSIKSSIVYLRDSTHFWELFIIAAENAEERTVALKRLVEMVSEAKDYDILREDGTITRAKSFIQAWEVFATDHLVK